MNKRNFLIFIGFCLVIVFMSSISGALNVSLSDQGTNVSDKSTGVRLSSGNLTIEIHDSLVGGNLIHNETFVGAIVGGAWNVMIGENASNVLQLEFGKIYYKDYAINNQDLNFTDYQGNNVGRQFFYSPLGDIGGEDINKSANLTIAGLNVTGNITVSGNVTASSGLFDWLGSLINRITTLFVEGIDFTGNINGSGNITTTGRVGIGVSAPAYKLEIADVENALNVSSVLYVNGTSGRVGIGKNATNPRYLLDVGKDTTYGGLAVADNGLVAVNWMNFNKLLIGGYIQISGSVYTMGIYPNPISANYPIFQIRGTTAQTGDLTQWLDVDTNVLAGVTSSGGAYFLDNVNITGNVTAENVFLPAYVSSHTNDTIPVASAGVWYNITFDQEVAEFKKRITHNFNDETNDTFTIQDTGTYEITYHLTFEDSQATPLNHVVARVIKNNVELNGFTIEVDTTKQNADLLMHHSDLAELIVGDNLSLQFTSDATTVSLTTHLTYGDHQNTGHITIKRIA